MSTCETCRFWQADFLEENSTSIWNVAGFRVCKCPALNQDFWNEGKEAGSGVCYLSMDAPVEFLTGPEFGCVHHESK